MNRSPSSEPLVRLVDVTKTFGLNEHTTTALHGVSLQAFPAELVMLLGPSGSGKTTLLTLIAGLVQPTSGVVSLFGTDIGCYSRQELQKLRALRIGFVFQTFLLLDALDVLENIALVCRFAGRSRAESRRRATELLRRLRIEHLAAKSPKTLSQGEKQRVAVARAIANDADLILADEPTASLETKQGFGIIQLLHGYAAQENKCVIIASHDLRIVEYADRVLRLEDGMLLPTTG
jgi:putative ABC transport system ATP-binding protein